MGVNVVAVVAAAVAMFVIGALWYMVLFAKIWGEMHGFNKLSKEKQKEAQSQMGPFYAIQILVTLISAWVLAYLMAKLSLAWGSIAFLLWLGFIIPAQVSAVIFGGTENKWMVKKIAIMAGGSLFPILAGAWVITWFY